MMAQLWTPPQAQTLPRVELPAHEPLTLADGRRLRPAGTVALGPHHFGLRWEGPKGLCVVASVDAPPGHGLLLHVSLSYPKHDPNWATIRRVRDAFYPASVDCMMVLPREQDYVAGVAGWEDSHVFHIWQTPSGWGVR